MADHSPGQWFGIVSSCGIALLPASVPLESVRQVWADLRLGRGIGAVIDGLVGAFGTSLSQLPSFAVLFVEADGSARVALRGAVEARLWTESAADPLVISGLGVSTWNERTYPDARRGALLLPGSPDEPSLPVADGIVMAGRIELELASVEVAPPNPSNPNPSNPNLPDPAAYVSPPDEAAPDEVLASAFAVAEPEPIAAPDIAVADVKVPDFEVIEPADVSAETSAEAPVANVDVIAPDPFASGTPAQATVVEIAEQEPVAEVDAFEPATDVGLVSAVPGREVSRAAETMVTEAVPTPYDQLLFGETVMSSVESAAVRSDGDPEDEAEPTPMISAVPLGGTADTASAWDDHDGETVLVDELLAAASAPLITGAAATVRTAASLLLPGRDPIKLDRSAVVGTRPKLTRVQAGLAPTMVSVESPNGEISRSHLELRVEGSDVLAVDLSSTNGTVLLRVGSDPLRLQPRETYLLVEGDQLDLGDGVVLSFAGLS